MKFFDIKRPEQKAATPRVVRVPQYLPLLPILQNPKFQRRIGGLMITLVSIVLVVSFLSGDVVKFKQDATSSAPKIYADFKEGAKALFGFDLEKARASFESANQQVASLNNQAPLSLVPGILSNLFGISQGAVRVSSALTDLRVNGLSMLVNKEGKSLLGLFQKLHGDISGMNTLSADLVGQAEASGYPLGPDFQKMTGDLREAEEFLAVLTDWLNSKNKQRLLLFFQNPSEMRPGGGFIGSYGIATLFQGNLLDISVRDIYDPDGQLDLKVIPPKPLRGITDTWEARDANWFFSFPTSARKVTEFLEASKIYSEQGVKFDGAVALNVEVLGDILETLGPIELAEYGITMTRENFLAELQSEIEAGDDKAKGEPKRILKVLTPIIFERLAGLDDRQKQALFEKFSARVAGKDLMAYLKDPVLENYLHKIGVSGEISVLPNDFFGDYLAVVDASVGGGKSDARIEQSTKLSSVFEIDGRIRNKLVITRSHTGTEAEEWWYRATNRAYIQAYTLPGAKLNKISGATPRTVKPMVNYGASFKADPDLVSLEKSASEGGKDIFAAWLDTKLGATNKLTFDYYSPYRFNFQSGQYQFIFDKQSGYRGGLEIEFQAPRGFIWKDSDSSVFSASFPDLPSRISLNLDLVEAPR